MQYFKWISEMLGRIPIGFGSSKQAPVFCINSGIVGIDTAPITIFFQCGDARLNMLWIGYTIIWIDERDILADPQSKCKAPGRADVADESTRDDMDIDAIQPIYRIQTSLQIRFRFAEMQDVHIQDRARRPPMVDYDRTT